MAESDALVAWLGFVLGCLAIGLGVWIRLGGRRSFVRGYFVPRPFPGRRNVVLAYIPIGLFFALGSLGMLLENTFLLLLGAAALAVSVWWMIHVPEFAKPDWVRAEEATLRAAPPAPWARRSPDAH